ncbi:MAG: hypothetical protein WCK98_01310 [bacterium]
MAKYYANLILLIISLLGYTSISNLKVLASTTNPNAVTSLFISEIAYDTQSLDYNQKCQPTDSKASCSFDKWFEIYNPSVDTSVKLNDIYFSVNDGKNLNQIVSSDTIKPRGYAVVHNSRVASGVIDTFKLDNTIASGKSGWVGSISGKSGSSYNIHLGIYYKDLAGQGVLINTRNINGLASQGANIRKSVEFNSPEADYTFPKESFLKIGGIDFYGSPSKGLIQSQPNDNPNTEIKQPVFAKTPATATTSPINTQPAQQLQAQQRLPTPAKAVVQQAQMVPKVNTKYALESGLNSQLNIELGRVKGLQQDLNLNIRTDQILAKSFKPISGANLNYSQNDFNYKLSNSTLFNSYSHYEIIFLDALILTLVGLKLITRSRSLKFRFQYKS